MLFLGELLFQFSRDLLSRTIVDVCSIGCAVGFDFGVAGYISGLLSVIVDLARWVDSGNLDLRCLCLDFLIRENIPREPELIGVGDAGKAAQSKQNERSSSHDCML